MGKQIKGILGTKLGMTQVFNDAGQIVPVTVVQAGPCVVTGVRTPGNDEELAAGTLTEAGGEPVVIQPVEADSFNRARFVFFTGSAAFTKANL